MAASWRLFHRPVSSSLHIFERTNKIIFIWRKGWFQNLLFYQMCLFRKRLVFSTHTVMQIPFIRLKIKFLAPGFHCLLWCYYPSLKENLKSCCLLEYRFKELCLSALNRESTWHFYCWTKNLNWNTFYSLAFFMGYILDIWKLYRPFLFSTVCVNVRREKRGVCGTL